MSRLLRPLFQRATVNSPSVPLSDAYDLLVAGEQSNTGIAVTEGKALGQTGFWKGVNLVTRAVAKTPVNVKRRIGENRVIDRNHPAWYLLRKLPTGVNYDVPCTPFIFKQTLMSGVLIQGNGYAYIIRDNQSNPVGLIWMDPRAVIPIKENGKLLYLITLETGETRRLNPMNVIHLKGLGYDGITGYSVIEVMKDCLGLNIAYEKNQSVFFKNGMQPGWVIEVPWKFRDEDSVKEFRRRLGKVHGGLEKAHIPAILENGAKANPLSVTREDSQFLQSREFDLRMLANIFFLPSSKFNDIAKVAYNSLEQENQSVLNEAYEPWFVMCEEEFEFKLLSEEQKVTDSHAITFERRNLVQTPFKDRIEGYNKGVLGGYFGRDEVRDWEDLNPMPNEEGKKFFVPVNVKTVGEESEPEPQQPQDEEMDIEGDRVKKARTILEQQLVETVNRLFKRRVVLASKRKTMDSHKFMDWLLDELVQHNRQAFVELIEPKIELLTLLENRDINGNCSYEIDSFLIGLRNQLNDLMGLVDRESLVSEVDNFLVRYESKIPSFVERLMQCK